MNDLTKQILLWVALAVILLAIFSQFGMRTGQPATIDYSQFLTEVKSNNIDSVTLKGEIIEGKRRDGDQFVAYNPETNNSAMIGLMNEHGVKFRGEPPKQQSVFLQLLISAFPILILIGFWAYFMRQMQGASGGRGAMSFGKSRAQALGRGSGQHYLCRRGRGRGSQARSRRNRRFLERSRQVPETWRQDPERCAHGGLARNRQDPAGQGHCRRGQGAVFHHFGLGFRGNVRRRGRFPRPRHVRAGQEACPLHHIHR